MFLKLVNRASTLGIAGFDLLVAAMPLGCLRNRASTWGLVGFDLLFAEMPLDISRTLRGYLRHRGLHEEWLVLIWCLLRCH